MITFIIKESLTSIKKAKASFLISLITMSISLILIISSVLLIDFSEAVREKLSRNIIINAFLNDSLSAEESNEIKDIIEKRSYIFSVEYISKPEAEKNFIKETGEDFRKILDYNPLPASLRITVNRNSISPRQIKKSADDIMSINGVDEVIYGDKTAEKVFYLINESKKYIFAITLVLILISIYIIYSTSNLIIKLRMEEMETMKLIGARIAAIKVPVILNAAFTGFIAGCISFLIFILFNNSLGQYISQQFSYKINYFLFLVVTILAGPVLGIIISYLTLRKITLKI